MTNEKPKRKPPVKKTSKTTTLKFEIIKAEGGIYEVAIKFPRYKMTLIEPDDKTLLKFSEKQMISDLINHLRPNIEGLAFNFFRQISEQNKNG